MIVIVRTYFIPVVSERVASATICRYSELLNDITIRLGCSEYVCVPIMPMHFSRILQLLVSVSISKECQTMLVVY